MASGKDEVVMIATGENAQESSASKSTVQPKEEEKHTGSKGGATQGYEALNVEARKLEMIEILEKDPNAELVDPETGQPISKRKRKRLLRWSKQRKLIPVKRKAYRERKRKRREEERKNQLENDKKMLEEGKITEKELSEIRKKRKKADQIRSRSRSFNIHPDMGRGKRDTGGVHGLPDPSCPPYL